MKYLTTMATSLVLLFYTIFASAQETEKPKYGWQKDMAAGVNLTQTSFDNWAQGGESAFAWQLNYAFKFVNNQEKTSWANSGKFNYGMTRVGNAEATKSIDEIKLESVFTYKIGGKVNPYVSATGVTQAGPGYDYNVTPKVKITNFMDPGYFRESVGFGFKPNENISTRAGFSLKQTVVRETKIVTSKNEVGAESVTDLDWTISDNSQLTSQLELFSNLKKFNEIDVNWDNVLTAKVSKYINLNFNVYLMYDRDVSTKRQLKQALAVGFSYTVF